MLYGQIAQPGGPAPIEMTLDTNLVDFSLLITVHRSLAFSQEVQVPGSGHGLGAAVDAELAVDIGGVPLDRADDNHHFLCDPSCQFEMRKQGGLAEASRRRDQGQLAM